MVAVNYCACIDNASATSVRTPRSPHSPHYGRLEAHVCRRWQRFLHALPIAAVRNSIRDVRGSKLYFQRNAMHSLMAASFPRALLIRWCSLDDAKIPLRQTFMSQRRVKTASRSHTSASQRAIPNRTVEATLAPACGKGRGINAPGSCRHAHRCRPK